MNKRRQHFMAEFDWIRTGLMFEPRGHDMMSGSILYPPTRGDTDCGLLFIETSGCSHVQWTGKPKHPEAHARNAVFYGDKLPQH
jgi:proline racemase